MSVTAYATLFFGVKLNMADIIKKERVSGCKHQHSHKFCPECGAPGKKTDVVWKIEQEAAQYKGSVYVEERGNLDVYAPYWPDGWALENRFDDLHEWPLLVGRQLGSAFTDGAFDKNAVKGISHNFKEDWKLGEVIAALNAFLRSLPEITVAKDYRLYLVSSM